MDLQLTLMLAFALQVGSSSPRNIVILVADDMGWNDVGFHGSEIPTPNLDALAYNGIVFKRHYAQPTCTPSRAALLTGKYPIRFGLQGHPIESTRKEALPTDVKLMPQVLKELGYRTHLVGKWHLGYPTWAHMPTRRGFDSFFGYLNGYLSYYDGVHYDPPNVGLDFRSNEEEAWPAAYGNFLPEVLCSKAEDIIKEHGNHHKSDPLFLMVATNAPHAGRNTPWVRERTPFRSNSTDFIRSPERRVMADVMRYVDDTMGNLTSALSSAGMLDNTLILFISDNGGNSSPDWAYYQGSSNYPFRGAKFSVFEGGVRVPAILWMSGLNFSAPRIYEGLFHLTDWLPTLNSAAGGEAIDGLDGLDHWAALTGNNNEPIRHELLVEIGSDTWAYLVDDFKFVKTFSSNSTASFTNNHFSPPIEGNPSGYQIGGVLSSAVARNLGILDSTAALAFRNQIIVRQTCSPVDQQATAQLDCSIVGCLYNVNDDPSECYDISDQHADIKTSLSNKLDVYRREMVTSQKTLPKDNHPNSRNYYAPSSGDSPPCNAVAISFFIMLLTSL